VSWFPCHMARSSFTIKGSIPHNRILFFFHASSRFAKEPAAHMFSPWAIQCKGIFVACRSRRSSSFHRAALFNLLFRR
jgi:hypothetical protein